MTEIYPFHNEDFLKSLSKSVDGTLIYEKGLPVVVKGKFLKRAYSLPFGFYGSFKEEPDYDYLKFLKRRYLKFALVDFNNKLNSKLLKGFKESFVETFIFIPQKSIIRKSRRRSISNNENKAKRYGISISFSKNHFEEFYRMYKRHYAERKLKVLKPKTIKLLNDYTILLNVLKGSEYMGGMLIVRLGNYALFWLMGWKKYKNFHTSEYMFVEAIEYLSSYGVNYIDFGASFKESVSKFKSSFGAFKHRYRFIWSYPV